MKTPKYITYEVDPDEYKQSFNFVEIVESCKFYSIGKNGKFELRLLITRLKANSDQNIFNLGFGVWNETYQDIDDRFETRNHDMQQILATVAQKALDFLTRYPLGEIYAEGSTSTRTRLYQREIAKVIETIPEELRLEGLVRKDDLGFIGFKKGINFDAFLLSLK